MSRRRDEVSGKLSLHSIAYLRDSMGVKNVGIVLRSLSTLNGTENRIMANSSSWSGRLLDLVSAVPC
jgi:hypothetical protein